MTTIPLIYGTDTGMTEDVALIIKERWKSCELEVIEVGDASKEDFERFDQLILGLSTWYDGDLQSDWENFYEDHFQEIDFTGKTVAIFGLGDLVLYPHFFVDGVGILAKQIIKAGGTIIGKWSNEEYEYEESVAEIEGEDLFYGLALDELNEAEQTDERLNTWLEQIAGEFGL